MGTFAWRFICFTLHVNLAFSKGGYSGGSYSGSYSGSSYASSGYYSNTYSQYSYSTGAGITVAGTFAGLAVLRSGSRRRYGTYYQEEGDQCNMAPSYSIEEACSNMYSDETLCYECVACETEDCIENITNCGDFLGAVYYDCCVEDCTTSSGPSVAAIIGSTVAIVVVFCICCFCCIACAQKASNDSDDEDNAVPSFSCVPGATETVAVVAPAGVSPGQMIQVMTPSGMQANVVVPPGVGPGQSFTIQVSAAACPQPVMIPSCAQTGAIQPIQPGPQSEKGFVVPGQVLHE
eukprot:gb/GFBE01070612.1/.p1 GENE.gb/GFBE01070612.1/~~gb/GFBE01070612.1/.p1  ORF type:complete len:291 (+),score=23.22 gb/GFBE01070612.1/:1-873(+)